MITPRTTAVGTRLRAAAAVLAAGLLLSGCGLLPSPAPSPVPTAQPAPSGASGEPQSQAQQCEQLMTEVRGIAADVARLSEVVTTNPLGALPLLGDITGRIGDLQTRVTDPELLQRIEEIQAGWDALVADAEQSFSAGDPSGIERAMTALTRLGEQVTALQEFCVGAE